MKMPRRKEICIMESRRERKINIIFEILIVGSIIYLLNLGLGFMFSKVVMRLDYQMLMIINGIINCLEFLVVPVIAVLLCMKGIEYRKIKVWLILLVTLGISTFIRVIEAIGFVITARFFGEMVLSFYSFVVTYLCPLIRAVLIVVILNLIDMLVKKVKKI